MTLSRAISICYSICTAKRCGNCRLITIRADVNIAQFISKHNVIWLSMQPADITIVKSMKNPPFGVKLVMAAVCVMKGIQPEKIVDPMGTGQKVRQAIYSYDLLPPPTRRLCDQGGLSFYINLGNFLPCHMALRNVSILFIRFVESIRQNESLCYVY